MPSAGELLRSERLKKNRTLADIAAQTCISRRYLEAIETDCTRDLPGEFFYKAFIRQYATALDLDSDTTDRILSSALPVSEPDPLPVLSQVYERAQSGDTRRWQPPTGVAVGSLVAVLAVGSLLYAWWQRATTPAEAAEPQQVAQQADPQPAAPPPAQEPAPAQVQPPPDAAATGTQPQPQGATVAPATPPVAPPTTPPTTTPTTTPTPAPALVAGQPGVEISANEPAWVQVSSDGKTLFIGTVDPNQPRQFPTGANAILRTGNAGALDVKWNGKSVGPIGPKGQVRVVRLTPEGAEVVPPKPKVVAPETTPQP